MFGTSYGSNCICRVLEWDKTGYDARQPIQNLEQTMLELARLHVRRFEKGCEVLYRWEVWKQELDKLSRLAVAKYENSLRETRTFESMSNSVDARDGTWKGHDYQKEYIYVSP